MRRLTDTQRGLLRKIVALEGVRPDRYNISAIRALERRGLVRLVSLAPKLYRATKEGVSVEKEHGSVHDAGRVA